jgi:small conductance mechanosensitive channel
MDLAVIDLAQLLEKLQSWLGAMVVMAPNVLLALLIVGAGVMGSRRLQRVIQSIFQRITGNAPISKLLGSASRVAVIVLACVWALALLHLDRTVTSLLAGVGVVGLALGFAFQDIAANFMSGLIMAMNRPFDVGDMVELAGRQCRVQHIHLRATEVETLDGLSIVVPNKDVFQNPIINYTRTGQRRMDLTIGTAYSDDMEKVRSVVLDAVKTCPARDPAREIELFFVDFADSSINFQVRVWLDDSSQTAYEAARSQAMIAIKKAFDSQGITIPFPIRTLDFGSRAVARERHDGVRMKVASRA